MADFTDYTPPGVYVQDESNPIVTATNAPSGLICIVGPARGFQQDTEVVPVYSNTPGQTPLRNRGLYLETWQDPVAPGNAPQTRSPWVTRADGTVLEPSIDYELVVANPSDAGGARNYIVNVVRLSADPDVTETSISSPNGVADGDSIVVSYKYADMTYYSPQLVEEYDDASGLYGEPFSADGQIASPLSVATRVAFANGATSILTLAVDPGDGDFSNQFEAAYAKILTDYRVSTLVPLFVDGLDQNGTVTETSTKDSFDTLANNLQAHCERAAEAGYARIGFLGAPETYDDSDYTFSVVATRRASKRIVLGYPNILNLSVNGKALEVGGYYLATAYAALAISDQVNRGLTKRIVQGFAGIPNSVQQKMTPAFKNELSKSGVSVAETDRLGRLSIRHGVTTKVNDLLSREVSLVRIADAMYQTVQGGLDAAELIGEPIDSEMTTRVKGVISGILERAVSDELIVSWQDLKVRQLVLPSGDPTVIECKFAYKAAVPLNYINVGFRIDLNNGAITETAA